MLSEYGKKFLMIYNFKQKTSLTCEQFFIKVMYPLLIEREVLAFFPFGNSPFSQNLSKQAAINKVSLRTQQLNVFQDKIVRGIRDSTTLLGGGSSDSSSTTSGQSRIVTATTAEDCYASWIGYALSMRVKGGICVLIDEPQILWKVFLGWARYALFIDKTGKGGQLEVWNACLVADIDYISTAHVPWEHVFVNVSNFADGLRYFYAFNIGQVNTTYGCYAINCLEIQNLSLSASYQAENLKDLFKFGVIGYNALRPKGFDKFNFRSLSPKQVKDIQEWLAHK